MNQGYLKETISLNEKNSKANPKNSGVNFLYSNSKLESFLLTLNFTILFSRINQVSNFELKNKLKSSRK